MFTNRRTAAPRVASGSPALRLRPHAIRSALRLLADRSSVGNRRRRVGGVWAVRNSCRRPPIHISSPAIPFLVLILPQISLSVVIVLSFAPLVRFLRFLSPSRLYFVFLLASFLLVFPAVRLFLFFFVCGFLNPPEKNRYSDPMDESPIRMQLLVLSVLSDNPHFGMLRLELGIVDITYRWGPANEPRAQ